MLVIFACMLKKVSLISKFMLLLAVFMTWGAIAMAQCSICTRTAQQLGEGPAKDLNAGIIYLAFTPLVIAGLPLVKKRKRIMSSRHFLSSLVIKK
jgi:hypothetical protein